MPQPSIKLDFWPFVVKRLLTSGKYIHTLLQSVFPISSTTVMAEQQFDKNPAKKVS